MTTQRSWMASLAPAALALAAVVTACGAAAEPAADPPLVRALRDGSYWPNQYRAAEELGKLGPAAKYAVPALIEATTAGHPSVRMAAARALGSVGGPAPEVLAALKKVARDDDRWVREAAVDTLAKVFDHLGARGRDAVPDLAAATRDADPAVRVRAVRALGRLSLA